MREFRSFRGRGQTMVLIALAAVALIAFVGLAIDGGLAYSLRRQSQNAADGGAIAGTWEMALYAGASPNADILRKVNEYAQANGVADTNGVPGDIINDNVLAYYVNFDGDRIILGTGQEYELHLPGYDYIPDNARGIEAVTLITQTTYFIRVVGQDNVAARATATARFQPDGGILPIAVNEYWAGSEGHCPYANCEEPYSFVRDPDEAPPFLEDPPGSDQWKRSVCADPLNDNVCQGAYDGYSENYGLAFAILGGDAKPNYGSNDPRSLVHLDYRYDGIEADAGQWNHLIASEQWQYNVKPIGKKDEMAAVIRAGGYKKVPLPAAVQEPPPAYIEDWGYCWALPHSIDNCFNWPPGGRKEPYKVREIPYEVIEFLSGADASSEAKAMYDEGNYVDGRYAPRQPLVIMVYNGAAAGQWEGPDPGDKDDAAVIVGYFGAIIIGYGNNFDYPCSCAPFDIDCFVGCVNEHGNPNTVYGMVGLGGDLTIDPTNLLDEFLPKQITLIR